MAGFSSRALGLLLLLLLPLVGGGLEGQSVVQSTGRLVRAVAGTEGDTVGVPGVRVVLHRVGTDRQGPVDSVQTDQAGRFRFRFREDTSAIFLVSARYAGIEYFSRPLTGHGDAPLSAFRIVVSDTSSSATVEIAERHIVIQEPDPSGVRAVLDLIVVSNPGPYTKVAADSTGPVFEVSFPDRAVGVNVTSQSDFSNEAVLVGNQRILVLAPMAPGVKQIMMQYDLPARPGTVSLHLPTVPVLNLLAVEPDISFEGVPLVPVDSQVIEGTIFRRYGGEVGDSGTVLKLSFSEGLSPRTIGVVLLATTLALFGGLAFLLLGRRVRQAKASATPATQDLVAELAALDDRFAGRRAEFLPEEWDRYLVERTRLKAELRHRLAGVKSKA